MASNKGEVEFLRSEAQKLREALRHERKGRCAADGEVQVTFALSPLYKLVSQATAPCFTVQASGTRPDCVNGLF